MQKINITQINNAHNRWLRSMEFYKQEIDILKKILSEITRKHPGTKIKKEIDHFDKALRSQVNSIDRLSIEIKENILRAGKQSQTGTGGYIDANLLANYNKLEEKFEAEETVINELRGTFHHFALEWM